MLQINTGKLYERGVGRINQLTGLLYANIQLPNERAIVTSGGTLRSAGSGPADIGLVYELEERIEKPEYGSGILISHTVAPFLDDFAVVASFGLGGVFSREPEIVRALTRGHPGFSSYDAPEKFVARFFDSSIYISEVEADSFVELVDALLALERQRYLGAMRAMRTFVAGLHRIADDLALAYTLMVSSMESLAQDFDGFVPAWSDLDDKKRNAIDAAVADLDPSKANDVRTAILRTEHVALARRYRDFVHSFVGADFFRQFDSGPHPIAGYELYPALRESYRLRSEYIHKLKPLPTAISVPCHHAETTSLERRPALTFQGLFRIARHTIRNFILGGPKVEREAYDYTFEQAGVISAKLAPQYWVGNPLTNPGDARERLEGLLDLIALFLTSSAKFVDLRSMLADVERLLPQAAAEFRPALLWLHLLYNKLVASDHRTPKFDDFFGTYRAEAWRPSTEALISLTVLKLADGWTIEDHLRVLKNYFHERTLPRGLHAPRLLEAAACLTLAEKFRAAGDYTNSMRYVECAVTTHPAHSSLREFESTYDGSNKIFWDAILL